MDYLEAVAAQPDRLPASRLAVTEGLDQIDLEPWRTGTLGVVAIGAAANAGQVFVDRLRRHGRRALSIDAGDVLAVDGRGGWADSYVLVSEGGRSRETVAAARLLAGRPRLAVTNVPDAPIADVSDAVVALGHGPDSDVYTVGYTASLQAFGLLARALDGQDEGDDWAGLPDAVAGRLDRAERDAGPIVDRLRGAGCIDVVGSGATRGTVVETALLLRESTRTATAAYETYQYLHGPIEAVDPGQAVILFGEGREVELAGYLAAAGVPTVLITNARPASEPSLTVVPVDAGPALTRAVLDVVVAQVIAGRLAAARGLAIDGFRHAQADTKIGGLSLAS